MGSLLGLSASSISLTLDGTVVNAIPLAIAVIIGIVLLVPAALFRKWYFYRRRLKKNIITAEYEAPLGLNPAEIGYLFDGKLREQEVGAIIISLVQNGLLHIKKVDGQKRLFAGPRIDDHLKTYEKKLIEEADTTDGVTAEQLLGRFTTRSTSGGRTISFGSKEFIFSQLVHTDLKKRGYVKGSCLLSFLWSSIKITVILQFILVLLPLGILFIFATTESGAFDTQLLVATILFGLTFCLLSSWAFFIAGMFIGFLRGRILGREWIITEKLERLWPQIVGYRQYIQMVEADKLEYHSKQLESKVKNDTLPYAVALGYVRNWRNIIG